MKNLIVVTGGAGFVGSNLIKLFLKKQIIKSLALTIIQVVSRKTILTIKILNTLNLTLQK